MIWLFAVCAMIFVMVIVGGVTRLTESGLSMVNWKPISGIIPPMNAAEWQAEFEAYRQYPEYQKVNAGMSLDEFKQIFFWEYFHRVLGRLIGLVFFIPFMYFLIRKQIKSELKPKLWLMFFLGGLQGLIGWWMVKSGLVDHPDVSHYRLTVHLGLAVLIYLYVFWVALGLMKERSTTLRRPYDQLARWVVILIFVQILLGGLVAGLGAGFVHNTWPMMDESIIPSGLFDMAPWYMNLTENIMTVQFNHRLLAYVITGLGISLWFKLYHHEQKAIGYAAHLFLAALSAQVVLGILTLIYVIPIPLAAAHQGGSVVLLSASLIVLHRLRL